MWISQRGNNKTTFTAELIGHDVAHGYCLPLPVSYIKEDLPEALVAPINIMNQSNNQRRQVDPQPKFQVRV